MRKTTKESTKIKPALRYFVPMGLIINLTATGSPLVLPQRGPMQSTTQLAFTVAPSQGDACLHYMSGNVRDWGDVTVLFNGNIVDAPKPSLGSWSEEQRVLIPLPALTEPSVMTLTLQFSEGSRASLRDVYITQSSPPEPGCKSYQQKAAAAQAKNQIGEHEEKLRYLARVRNLQ